MEFKINKTYDFSTLSSVILGTNYKNMRVKAFYNAEVASRSMDIQTLHKNMMAMVPGLPDNVNDLTYIVFVNMEDKEITIPYEYINTTSIKETTVTNIQINVYQVNDTDAALLRKYLSELGYTNFTVTLTN